jgi:hypothetical protein
LNATYHGREAGFASAESDAVHELPHEILRERERDLGRLIVHRRKRNRQHRGHRGRLAHVHVGPHMQRAVRLDLGEEVHPRIALRHSVGLPLELGETGGQRFEPFGLTEQRLHARLPIHGAKALEGTGDRGGQGLGHP